MDTRLTNLCQIQWPKTWANLWIRLPIRWGSINLLYLRSATTLLARKERFTNYQKPPIQADAYLELIEPHRADILESSVRLAQELLSEYNGVTYEELAVEIAVGASFS